MSNICPYKEDLDKHILNLKSWCLEREYSKQMIVSQMGKVKFCQRIKAGSKQAGVGVPFVITYHTKKIMKKLEYLLRQDESVKRLFTPPKWFPTTAQEN